jgi:hypothetical protein
MQGNAPGDPTLLQGTPVFAAAEQVRAAAAAGSLCTAVSQAVMNFQGEYNALGGNTLSTDGKYGQDTAMALASLYDSSVTLPDPCPPGSWGGSGGGGGSSPSPSPGPGITPVTPPGTLAPSSTSPSWLKWLIGGLLVAAVAFLGWTLAHKPKHRAGKVGGHSRRMRRHLARHRRR